MGYNSLHVHSCGSLLDGYQTIPELVGTVKSLGQSAVALTEHGTMRTTIMFYKECQRQGIKPIVGCEFYFCSNHLIKDKGTTHHLVLLAMNNEGYMNLKRLDSIAYGEEHYFYKPRIDWEDLKKHNAGLICLSACMASIVNTENGEYWFKQYKELFGDRFYAEIQPLNIPEQQEYNDKVISLARKYEVELVCTTDAHFAKKEDQPYHSLWIGSHGASYHDNENYLWSEEEIRSTSWLPKSVIEECIKHTQDITDRCNVTIELTGSHYPTYPTEDSSEEIRKICRAAWKNKVPKGKSKLYAQRFEEEMKDLEATNYMNYLLVVWSMLDWCEKNNIPTGFGRGSFGGSLVGYLMGMHRVDPLIHGTKFYRFCNRERVSPPDIDTDVSTANRGKVIEQVKKMYGNVCKVQTIGYTKNPSKDDVGKAAVQMAGQALAHIDADKWTAEARIGLIKQLTCLEDILTIPSDFSKEDREQLYDIATHFCGRINKIGCHASAVLVTPDDVTNYSPIEGMYSTNIVTGKKEYIRAACYDFHDLEEMGCLKLDILGLGTLDVIADTVKDLDVDINKIPINDKATYDLYASGQLLGVFQMDSPGMRNTAKELHVSNFSDVAALVALYRPGAIDSGMLQQYIDGKNGADITYPCKEVEEIAGDTYGVLVYQEEVMEIAMRMAGYSLGQADVLRKVIGRKEITKIDEAVKNFVEACVERGYDREVASTVAEQIRAAGRYIFNKCIAGNEYLYRDKCGRWQPSIGEMYRIKNDKVFAKNTGHFALHKKYNREGYGCAYSMGDNGITLNKIVDITYSGKMPVYILTTEKGRQVRCTLNHKIPTTTGIKLLAEINIGDSVYIDGGYDMSSEKYLFYQEKQILNSCKGSKGFIHNPNGESAKFDNCKVFYKNMMTRCEKCGREFTSGFELHHIDHDRNNNTNENLQWLCNSCHKRVHYQDGRTKKGTKPRLVETEKVIRIEYDCDEDCYDIEMQAPNHNFIVSSGIVVCNSHSTEYGLMSYITAYLKVHYPLQYMCSLLNSKSAHEDLLPYIEEVKRMGIKLLPPSYKVGNLKWVVEGDAIRVGLTYIKGVSRQLVVVPDAKWGDIVYSNNKKVMEGLIKSGALDYLEYGRGWMLSHLSSTQQRIKRRQQCEEKIKENKNALANAENAEDEKAIKKYKRQLEQWEAKMNEIHEEEVAATEHDDVAGEMEVLSFSFKALPKIRMGKCTAVNEFNDKKGRLMARVSFSMLPVKFNDAGLVFASNWKKKGKYGITIEVGKTYEYINEKGIIKDAREVSI